MSKRIWILLVPLLVLGLAACQSSQDVDESVEPSGEQAAVVEEQAEEGEAEEAPTEAERSVAEPVSGEADGESVIDPEFADLWALEYELTDGLVESPMEVDEDDGVNLVLLERLVAVGDLNGDGTPDRAAVLVDLNDPENPNSYIVVVLDESGTPVHSGTVALDPGTDVNAVRIVDGMMEVDVWVPTADGTWQRQTVTYQLESGGWVPAQPPESQPVPTPVPTDAEMPPAPSVTVSVKPDVGVAGMKYDIHAHAFGNPHITELDCIIDGEKVSEWRSSDPEGVPYTHQTFTIRNARAGSYVITVVARDKFGSEGVSLEERYTVR